MPEPLYTRRPLADHRLQVRWAYGQTKVTASGDCSDMDALVEFLTTLSPLGPKTPTDEIQQIEGQMSLDA